ncbi:hypothetical protein LO762_03395 [Actinocorallia sp. API 0066]|uniref:hypothetical protein n=1 Tax=Actinocorallia sp. API 0066 TaxID=2896846 RepID=UPI001E313AD9|nr:hypothetical protein [Actinocorallia sp. API 0066]MCD0448243.1 hypothetical protein [Actinocorallia sp. API 0066]
MNARRISRRAAEQMLGGNSAGHDGPLTDLLAAAASPGRPEELAGEENVMAAFQEAFAQGSPISSAPRRGAHRGVRSSPLPAVLSRRSARAWTIRVSGAVLVVGAVGGVAIASGGVPGRNPVSTPKKPTPSMSAPPLTRKQAPAPVTPAPAASPSALELCKALLDGKSRKQLEPLIKAAGGRQKALALCKALVTGQGGVPTDWPKDWPSERDWRDWQNGWPQGWDRDGKNRHDRKDKHDGHGRPGKHDKAILPDVVLPDLADLWNPPQR